MLTRQIDLGGVGGGGVDSVVQGLGKSGVRVALIEPAATFTAATPTDGGSGTIILTSAGAHGLTAARAVTPGDINIHVSAGNGWTPGFYRITALDTDTTGVAITIQGTFSGGMGSPTIALANTEVTIATVPVPTLLPNSMIEVDASWDFTGSTNNKNVFIRLDGTAFYNPGTVTAAHISNRVILAIQNRGVTNSQVNSQGAGAPLQLGMTTVPITTGTVNTSIVTSLTITVKPSVANEFMALERYVARLWK